MSEHSLINGKTQILGVVGDPVQHSLSPLTHNFWFGKLKINAVYLPFHMKGVNVHSFLNGVRDSNIKGLNITVPHKQTALDICDALTPQAEMAKAVNTVLFKGDKIIGHNTDIIGFKTPLLPYLERLKNKPIVILGAGGAARAVVIALKEISHNLIIINRTIENAQKLADDLHIQACIDCFENLKNYMPHAAVIINTTSIEMNTHSHIKIDFSVCEQMFIAYDLIYKPAITPFLEKAKNQGINIINGLPMLVEQARAAFQFWYDILPSHEWDAELYNQLNDQLCR